MWCASCINSIAQSRNVIKIKNIYVRLTCGRSQIKTIPKEHILVKSHTRKRVMNSLQKNILWSLSSAWIKIDVWVRYEWKRERGKVMTTKWKAFYSASKFIATTTTKPPNNITMTIFQCACSVNIMLSIVMLNISTHYSIRRLIISKCLLLPQCESHYVNHEFYSHHLTYMWVFFRDSQHKRKWNSQTATACTKNNQKILFHISRWENIIKMYSALKFIIIITHLCLQHHHNNTHLREHLEFFLVTRVE